MITIETHNSRGEAIRKEFYTARGAWQWLSGKGLYNPDGITPINGNKFFRMFGEDSKPRAGDFKNKFGDKLFIKKV